MSWGGPEIDKGEAKVDPTKGGEGSQAWKKTVDTHKMSPESVKAAGVEASQRPPGHGHGHGSGEVLHQRGRLPFGYGTMTLAGIAIIGVIGYGVLYSKKKSEVSALDVARVATNTAQPEHTEHRPRK